MHSVSISQKAPKWVIAGSIENNGHNWLRMIILLLLESMTGIHAGSTLAGPLYEMMGWDAADRGLTGGQMVIWTPAVRSATWPVSLTKLSAVDVNRSKLRSTMPVIPVLSPCPANTISGWVRRAYTCFVTESMSRMYRSCSWRTPAAK